MPRKYVGTLVILWVLSEDGLAAFMIQVLRFLQTFVKHKYKFYTTTPAAFLNYSFNGLSYMFLWFWWIWQNFPLSIFSCHEVVVTTAKVHLANPELKFCILLVFTGGTLEAWDGNNLWKLSRVEIRLNTFYWSTISQETIHYHNYQY